MSSRYSSAPSGVEWKQIKHVFDRFQFVEHDPRTILNGILCVPEGGIQWRMLLSVYPPWQTVYYHFRKWRVLNLFQRLCDRIRRAARVAEGRRPSPSAAVADSQSVQTVRQGGPEHGPDPSKQVKERGATCDYRYSRIFARSGGQSCKRHRQTMPSRPASMAAWESSSTESDLRRQRLQRSSRQSNVAMLPLCAQCRRARGPAKRIRSTAEGIGP
jgi:transposase